MRGGREMETRKAIVAVGIVFLLVGTGIVALYSYQKPIANAGPDMVVEVGEIANFNASQSWGAASFYWSFRDNGWMDLGAKPTHVFNQEGVYEVGLIVEGVNAKQDLDTVLVNVINSPPIAIAGPDITVIEDDVVSFTSNGSYDTSSDNSSLSFAWDFGDGTSANGMNATHIYSNSGTYSALLTVRDDHGAIGRDMKNVTVRNMPPSVTVGNQFGYEGKALFLTASGYDTPSDSYTLRYSWDNGKNSSETNYLFQEDGEYKATVVVNDNDDASSSAVANIIIENVAPTTAITRAFINADITLRASGEKWHDLQLFVYKDGVLDSNVTVFRIPGGPNEQSITIDDYVFDLTSQYEVNISYTPENDPINGQIWGSTPAWFVLTFNDGSYESLQNDFNAQHPDTWNWTLFPTYYMIGHAITFESATFDPGLDSIDTLWSFGDGSTIGSQYSPNSTPVYLPEEVEHAYESEGIFSLSLLASDDDSGSDSFSTIVTIDERGIFVENTAPKVQIVTDNSNPDEDAAIRLYSSIEDNNDDISAHLWDFGDGIFGEGSINSHSYRFSGGYIVALYATDGHNSTGVACIKVEVKNVKPTAFIVGEHQIFTQDQQVFLEAKSVDTPSDIPSISYRWDFGDGCYSYGIKPSHSFTAPGSYNVTLTVTDNDREIYSIYAPVTVLTTAPTAFFSPITVYGNSPVVTFFGYGDDTCSDVSSLAYCWDFGDGNNSIGQVVTHVYEMDGDYIVSLIVTDSHGANGFISTNALIAIDTDGDGLKDADEIEIWSTYPEQADTDGDDVIDYFEIFEYNTHPTDRDSDFDGLWDWYEIAYLGYDVDTDDDGLNNTLDWDSDEDDYCDGNDSMPLVFEDHEGTYYQFVTVVKNLNGSGFDIIVAISYKSLDWQIWQSQSCKPIISVSSIPPIEGLGVGPVFQISLSSGSSIQFDKAYIKVRYPAALNGSWFSEEDLRLFEYDDWTSCKKTGINESKNYAWGTVSNVFSSAYQLGDLSKIDSDKDGLSDADEIKYLYPLSTKDASSNVRQRYPYDGRLDSPKKVGFYDFDSMILPGSWHLRRGSLVGSQEYFLPEWTTTGDWSLQLPSSAPQYFSLRWQTITSDHYHSDQFAYGVDGWDEKGNLTSPIFEAPSNYSGNIVVRFWTLASPNKDISATLNYVTQSTTSGTHSTYPQSSGTTINIIKSEKKPIIIEIPSNYTNDGWQQKEIHWNSSALSTPSKLMITFNANIANYGCFYVDDVEILLTSDPHNNDSDGDKIIDGDEVHTYGTNPISSDTDGDGLSDWDEIFVYNTSATIWDSDFDGLSDKYEVYGWDVFCRSNWTIMHFTSNPAIYDTDNDSLNDLIEFEYGLNPRMDADKDGDTLTDAQELNGSLGYVLDVNLTDTDSDGLRDDYELFVVGLTWNATDPTRSDTDGDGSPDGEEVYTYQTDPTAWTGSDWDHDGISNDFEINGVYGYVTSAIDKDTDGDRLSDYQELLPPQNRYLPTNPLASDTDGDYISDYQEVNLGYDGVITDPNNPDTDNDGLLDGEESNGWTYYSINNPSDFNQIIADSLSNQYFMDHIRSGWVWSSPLASDTDNDGLSDYKEYLAASHPRCVDTDGDRYLDGEWISDYQGVLELEDPSIYEHISPYVNGYGIKYSWSFNVDLFWCASDRNGIQTVQIMKNEEMLATYSYAAGTFSLWDQVFHTGIDLFSAFSQTRFWINVTDTYGNSQTKDLITVTTLFQYLAKWFAENIPLIGPYLGGFVVGAMHGLSDSFMDIIYALTHLGDIFNGFSQISSQFREDETGTLANILSGFVSTIDQKQIEENPFQTTESGYDQFRYSWYVGYVIGMTLAMVAGGAAAKAVAGPIVGAVSSGISKLSKALGELSDVSKVLLKFGRASLSKPILLVSASLATLYGLAEIWPETFGYFFDQGGAYTMTFMTVFSVGNEVKNFHPNTKKILAKPHMSKWKSEFNQIDSAIKTIPDDWAPTVVNKIGDIIDARFTSPNKYVQYIKACFDKYPGAGNPLTSTGQHKLLKMFHNSKGVNLRVGDDISSQVMIPDEIILKKGYWDPSNKDISFGLERIKNEHGSEFEAMFGQMDDQRYSDYIGKTINNPSKDIPLPPNQQGKIGHTFAKQFGDKWVVVEVGDLGSITSAYPCSSPPSWVMK